MKMIGVPAMVKAQQQGAPLRFLDVAGGTGDISFRIIKALERSGAFNNANKGVVAEQQQEPSPSSVREGDEVGDKAPLRLVPEAMVTVSDINPEMLGVGKQRALNRFTTPTLKQVGVGLRAGVAMVMSSMLVVMWQRQYWKWRYL